MRACIPLPLSPASPPGCEAGQRPLKKAWRVAESGFCGAQVEELAALSCRFTSLHCALRVGTCVHMCDHVAPPLPAAATAGVWIAALSCDLCACHRQAVPRALVTCSPRTDGLFPDVLVVMSREVVGSCYFPLLGQGFLPTGAQAHLCSPLPLITKL